MTPRQIVTKGILSGILLFALITIIMCPCERVGRCHWELIMLSLGGAMSLMAIENLIPVAGVGVTGAAVGGAAP